MKVIRQEATELRRSSSRIQIHLRSLDPAYKGVEDHAHRKKERRCDDMDPSPKVVSP